MIHEHIQRLAGRQYVRSKEGLRLDWNETYWTNPHVVAKLIEYLRMDGNLSAYPDTEATELTERLAEYHGIDKSEVLVFPGLDVAIDTIFRTFKGSPTIEPEEYSRAKFYRDVKGNLLQGGKIRYISDPHNPTGERGNRARNDGELLVIDQTYADYSSEGWIINLADEEPIINLLSFSKVGLAGIRLGYVIAPFDIIDALRILRNGKDVSTLAQIAGLAHMDSLSLVWKHVHEVIQTRDWFRDELLKIGYDVPQSYANFVFLRGANVADALAKLGIYVRQFDTGTRITISRKADMERVLDGLPKTA
jgi:histidinol-phosphate aminotransferase